MVVILDYGMGNVVSIRNALSRLGYDSIITNNASIIDSASHLILPGVGAFHSAMNKLDNLGLVPILRSYALDKKKPILGICLGMQLLGNSSTEGNYTNGLGIINNKIIRFEEEINLTVPHVGFNSVNVNYEDIKYTNLPENADFYFTHSYYMLNHDQKASYSYTHHGDDFVASFSLNNIHGAQFHPEKSQDSGLLFLKNFLSTSNA